MADGSAIGRGAPVPASTAIPPPTPTRDGIAPLSGEISGRASAQPGHATVHSSAQAAGQPASEWETSPMHLALSTRLAKTEQSLSSLSAQVASLTTTVRQLQSGSSIPPPLARNALPGQVFSPFEGPDPKSPFLPSTANPPPNTADPTPDEPIAALTTQIAALSASVAQLQRLQNQSHLTRQNSHATNGPPHHFNNGGHVNLNTGQMSGGQFNHRPRIDRSISTSVVQSPAHDRGDKWGPGKFAPIPNGNGSAGMQGLAPGARDWSPGPGGMGQNNGQMTPSVVAPAGQNGNNNGVAAPGAGIVVTKWEHLNLKVELLRSIAKYGIGPPNKIQARVLPFMLKGSDIIAQAPPTQERIIAYVIPALQLCLSLPSTTGGAYRGPNIVIVTTTVDQATQCHKLVRSVGGPLGVRSALAAGASGSSALPGEVAQMQRDAVQLLIGTPAKIAEVLSPRGLNGSEVRLLILDEVDQLIARNLYEHVLNITKLLPAPRRTGQNTSVTGPLTPNAAFTAFSPGAPLGVTSPFDPGMNSPFNPASKTPFPGQNQAPPGPSRFGAPGAPPPSTPAAPAGNAIERQTCIFSNTIPTDVINFSQQLQVRDPVRVLVRREGGVNSQESVSSVTPGINIKHTYVYLTITPSARADAQAQSEGPGTIGSGRQNANGGASEEVSKAKEYKLDMLITILDDYPLWQAVIHVGTYSMLEAVVYKLQNRQWETLYLSPDMPPPQKKAILQQWRLSLAGNGPRFLVIFDVNVKPPEIPWAPLVINFDLPRSVEGYAHRAAAAVPPSAAPRNNNGVQVNGVIVSFVQAAGGDVEMLRSTECAYRFKSAEIPSVFHDLFQH